MKKVSVRVVLGIFLLMALVGASGTSNVVVAIDEPSHAQGVGVQGEVSPSEGCTTVPTLLAPENGATLATLNPLLQWDAGADPDATGVQVERSPDPTFSQDVHRHGQRQGQGISEWHVLDNLAPCRTYYWRAALTCDSTQGPWSEVWSFTTGCVGTILPGPTLVAPERGALIATLPAVLSWLPVEGAVEYRVCWTDVQEPYGAFCAWTQDTQIALTQWDIDPVKEYEWWVEARSEYAVGEESERWRFRTADYLPTPTHGPTCSPTRTRTPMLTPTNTLTRTPTGSVTARPTDAHTATPTGKPTTTPTGEWLINHLWLPIIVRSNSVSG